MTTFFGGGRSTNSTVTQTTELAPEQKDLLRAAIPAAKQFAKNPPKFPSNAKVLPFTPLQIEGQSEILKGARSARDQLEGIFAAQDFGLGAVLFPETNPALQSTINAAIRPVVSEFDRVIAPRIDREAVAAGQFGGSRHGVAQGIAADALLQEIGDITAKISTEGFNRGLDTFEKTLFASPSLLQAAAIPGSIIESVGAAQRDFQQAKQDLETQKEFFNDTRKFLAAKDVASLAFGGGGGVTTSTATTPLPRINPLSTALGAASLATTFGFPAAAGAGLGLLAALL